MKKGRTNNPNGRPIGIPNKKTQDLRKWINEFISINTIQIEKDWKTLDPKERIMLFEKLLKYSLPTLQAVGLADLNVLQDKQPPILIVTPLHYQIQAAQHEEDVDL